MKLKAPEGTTEVSFAGKTFKVGSDGLVDVPDDAVLGLYQFGFTAPPDDIEPVKPAARTKKVLI